MSEEDKTLCEVTDKMKPRMVAFFVLYGTLCISLIVFQLLLSIGEYENMARKDLEWVFIPLT
jgi:hypothetical protein